MCVEVTVVYVSRTAGKETAASNLCRLLHTPLAQSVSNIHCYIVTIVLTVTSATWSHAAGTHYVKFLAVILDSGSHTVKTGSRPRSQFEVETFVNSDKGDRQKKLQRKYQNRGPFWIIASIARLRSCIHKRGLQHSKITEVFARFSRHLDLSWRTPSSYFKGTSIVTALAGS